MLYEQFEELKSSGKLPTPSGVGLRILVLTRSEDCSLDELARTLQADPALTGRVLKLANSAVSAGMHPATHVRDAGVRLGLRTVCNVALGFSLISGNRTGRCAAFDYDGYWSWSLANAVAAEQLSRELGLGSPGEAFTLGLLARVGRLALASVHAPEYARVLGRLRNEPDQDLAQLEREAFCINHRQVGAAIAEDWGLPPIFAEVLLHLGLRIPETLESPESRSYLRLLGASARVADVLAGGSEPGALWPAAREVLVELGIAREHCQRCVEEIGGLWKDWGTLLHVPADFNQGTQGFDQDPPAVDEAPAANGEPSKAQDSLRILVVDDEPTSLHLVTTLLRQEGHRVVTARNGEEALDKVLADPPQMVVTDWMMPGMDGLELCKRLREVEQGKDLYILIVTGQSEEHRIVEAFEAGADDYVAKPFKHRILRARIRPGIRVINLQENLKGQVLAKEDANRHLAIEKRRFKHASLTDALTDLPNRRYAMKRLEKEWATSRRAHLPLSVILLDIDHFKQINDTHGHDGGDEVLRSTAHTVQDVLRTSDNCTRMGGEEFLVICPGTPIEGARLLAERIRAAVEANEIQLPSLAKERVTVSLGVACNATAGITSIDALLKSADEGVYLAKHAGRNRVAIASGPQGERKTA